MPTNMNCSTRPSLQMAPQSSCRACRWKCLLPCLRRSSWSVCRLGAWRPPRWPSKGARPPLPTTRCSTAHCRCPSTRRAASSRSSTRRWRSPCRGLRGEGPIQFCYNFKRRVNYCFTYRNRMWFVWNMLNIIETKIRWPYIDTYTLVLSSGKK